MSDVIQIQEQPDITISIVGNVGPTISTTDGFYIPDWGAITNKPDFDSLYYPLSNPSGYITGGDFATQSQLSSVSGALRFSISGLESQTGNYYPRSNPSGYLAGSVVRPNTYTLYDASTSLSLDWNVEQLYSDGFLAADWRSRTLNDGLGSTSLDWTNRSLFGAWTLDTEATGNNDVVNLAALVDYAYPRSNPSGFATGIDVSLFVLKSETGSYSSLFYPLLTNPSGYVTGDVVRPSQTGLFLTSSSLSGYATQTYVNNASGALRTDISYLQTLTGDYYPRTNPSGFITGFNSGDYVTGQVVRPSETGDFATQSYVAGVSGAIRTDISLIQSTTGDYTGLFYPLSSNPANYVTGLVVRPSETGAFITSSQTGQFYPMSNPSGYATGVDVSNLVSKSETGVYTDIFYPRLLNPSGYVSGQVVRPSETGDFITQIIGDQRYVNITGAETISGAKTFVSKITAQDGVDSNGNILISKGNPRLRFRDSNAGGHSQGFDIHVSTDRFYIDDNTHNLNIIDYHYDGVDHTLYAGKEAITKLGTSGALEITLNPFVLIRGANGNMVLSTEEYNLSDSSGVGSVFFDTRHLYGEWYSDYTGALSSPLSLVSQGKLTGYAYPLDSNPSGYLTGQVVRPADTGSFITSSQTGQFYPMSNPSGFATGVDVSNLVLKSETGAYTGLFYPLGANPSGYVTGNVVRPTETGAFLTTLPSDIVRTNGDQNISGDKNFYDTWGTQALDVGSRTIYDDNGVVSVNCVLGQLHSPYNVGAGASLSWLYGILYDVSGNPSAEWFTRQLDGTGGYSDHRLDWSGPSGILSGEWISNSSSTDPFSIVNNYRLTGYAYPLLSNPAGYVTGSVVRPTETGSFVTSGQTGQFYPASNPSGFATGIDASNFVTIGGVQTITGSKNFDSLLAATGASSEVKLGLYVGGSALHPFRVTTDGFVYASDLAGNIEWTTEETALRYLGVDSVNYGLTRTLSDISGQPSVYWSDRVLTGRWTNSYSASASGDIVNYHSLTGFAYPLIGNPSGFITGSVVRPSETGGFASLSYVDGLSRVSSISSLTGSVLVTGAGSVATSISGQTIVISGSASGSSSPQTKSITLGTDGGLVPLSTGILPHIKVPFGGSLLGFTMVCKPSGSVSFDVLVSSDGSGLPASSIINNFGGGTGVGTLPAITSGVEGKSTSFSGWSRSTLTDFDNVALRLASVDTGVCYAALTLYYQT